MAKKTDSPFFFRRSSDLEEYFPGAEFSKYESLTIALRWETLDRLTEIQERLSEQGTIQLRIMELLEAMREGTGPLDPPEPETHKTGDQVLLDLEKGLQELKDVIEFQQKYNEWREQRKAQGLSPEEKYFNGHTTYLERNQETDSDED